MKKIILFLMALFVVSNIGFASNNAKIDNTQTITPQMKNFTIDLGDITSLTNCELSKLISESIVAGLSPLPVLQCSVTVTAKLTIAGAEISISVTVSGDCSEVRSSGAAIAQQIINGIRSYFESYF